MKEYAHIFNDDPKCVLVETKWSKKLKENRNLFYSGFWLLL